MGQKVTVGVFLAVLWIHLVLEIYLAGVYSMQGKHSLSPVISLTDQVHFSWVCVVGDKFKLEDLGE